MLSLFILFSAIAVGAAPTDENNSKIFETSKLFYFEKPEYIASPLAENSENGTLVISIKASTNNSILNNNPSASSSVIYKIIAGNTHGVFRIASDTGDIRVNQPPDYEKVSSYNLTISASNNYHSDKTVVRILIININDNPPIFSDNFEREITIPEEEMLEECIIKVDSYDRDIPNRCADQHIVYTIESAGSNQQSSYFKIDRSGCLKLTQPLDRDLPNGRSIWEVIINARDEDASPQSLQDFVKITINLIDINDNPPVLLDNLGSIVWRENQEPGNIIQLKANDYDSPSNAGPFNFRIDEKITEPIVMERFNINGDFLVALVSFDREERKEYNIPLLITDSGTPGITTKTNLTIVIGDVNDNKIEASSKSVVVRTWRGKVVNVNDLRVDVNDPDDELHWDDYHFTWDGGKIHGFNLDPRNGTITAMGDYLKGSYLLKFEISEESQWVKEHSVKSTLYVTFKEISDDADYQAMKKYGVCTDNLDC